MNHPTYINAKMMQSEQEPAFNGQNRLVLPDNYKPTEDVVIIGRGRKVKDHNKWFYELIDVNLDTYEKSPTKGMKSTLLWNVLTQIKANSKSGIAFVKKEAGQWIAVDDASARINIAQAFRDRLSHSYKSSKQHKSIKRKQDLGQLPLPCSEDPLLNENVLADMVFYDLQQEHPSKRVCRESASFSSPPSFSSTNGSMDALRGILNSASNVLVNTTEDKPTTAHEDTFSCLMKRLDCIDITEDPFEPKPIRPEQPKIFKQISSCSDFRLQERPITASSCIFEKHFFEPILAMTSSSHAPHAVPDVDFSEDNLEQCFGLMNSFLANDDSLLMSGF
jgi:hypothetical protein